MHALLGVLPLLLLLVCVRDACFVWRAAARVNGGLNEFWRQRTYTRLANRHRALRRRRRRCCCRHIAVEVI